MLRIVLGVLVGLGGVASAPAQEPVVWVASPWQHVLRGSEPGKTTSVQIAAARNEYEPLRIIVRAGAEPLTRVSARASELVGPGSTIAPTNVALFQERYIHIFEPSRRSKAPAGWYPDPLVPMSGDPFTVEPGMNQGIWADVFVPRDTTPGEYSGTITVTAGEMKPVSIPVKLRVLPFTLPDRIAMRSNFGNLGSRLARSLGMDAGSKEFAAVEDQYIDILLAHRAIPSSLGDIWPSWSPEGGIDDSTSGERLRTMVEDRHVNALRVPFLYSNEPEKCRAYLRDMAAYLQSKGWLDLAYIYLKDEPNDAEEYEIVRKQGELIRASGIKRLCTEQTITSNPDWGTLYGAVDIWCPLWCLYDETTARQRQELGEEIWTYTALCQGKGTAPFWEIDFAPLQYRAPFWTSWHYGVKGFLYWSSIYWAKDQDPWTRPHFRDQYWGEGMLLYPGEKVGLKGPAPSIRLKLIREALEDFEYMTLAASQGHKADVDKIVAGLTRSFNDWSQDPKAYMTARTKLAALIAAETVRH